MTDTPYRDVNMGVPSPMLGGGFDPQTFWQNYGQRKQNLMIRKLDQEAQNKAAWMREYDPSKLIPSKIYSSVKDEIAKEINTLTEDQASWAAGQGPPKNWAKAKQRINYLTAAGETVQKTMEKYAELATKNPEKFNPQEYYKWAETVDKLPTIEEKEKFIRTTRPYTEQIDIGEVFADWIGDESTFEEGTTTTKRLDPELLKQRMDTRFRTLPREKQRSTLDTIYTTVDPATGKPVATNYQEALDYVTNMMLPMGSVSVTKDEPPRNNNNNSDGGGDSKSKLLISGSKDTTEGLDQSGNTTWNRVSVKRAGTNDDLPAIRVFSDEKDDKGNNVVIEFQPSEFVMGKDGKIGVRGVKLTTTGGGTSYASTTKEDVWVDYDLNKDAFESQLEDRSMYDIMREKREAQGGQPAAPAQGGGKKQAQVTVEQSNAPTNEKYPLPSGKPMRGRKGDTWYVWDSSKGLYVPEKKKDNTSSSLSKNNSQIKQGESLKTQEKQEVINEISSKNSDAKLQIKNKDLAIGVNPKINTDNTKESLRSNVSKPVDKPDETKKIVINQDVPPASQVVSNKKETPEKTVEEPKKSKLIIGGDTTPGLYRGDDVKLHRVTIKNAETKDYFPPLSVYSDMKDDKGNNVKIDFQPQEFVISSNGIKPSDKPKIGVRGVWITKTTDASGKSVESKQTVWVDYDLNKDTFEPMLEGKSMYDIMREGSVTKQEPPPKMTLREFNEAWRKLKPGEKIIGLNGREYTK